MLPRFHIRREGHRPAGLAVANDSQALRCNKHVFVAGQADLDEEARVRHPGDLAGQARGAMGHVAAVLEGAAADLADVVKLTEAPTVNGKPIVVKVSGSTVTLNDKVKVTKTDIAAKNGVIHVIDAVLLPPA